MKIILIDVHTRGDDYRAKGLLGAFFQCADIMREIDGGAVEEVDVRF